MSLRMDSVSPSAESPSKAAAWRHIFTGAVEAWLRHRAASKGAALAFYTLFSMAPVLILVIAIAGAFFGAQAAQGEIVGQLSGLLGSVGAEAIQTVLVNAVDAKSGVFATAVATVLLLVGATTVFAELKDSLDEIWQAPKPPATGVMGVLRSRLLSFGLILVLGFLLLVSLAVNAVLAVLENYWRSLSIDFLFVLGPLSSLVSFLVIASLFAAIFKMLPQVALAWRDVWVGAIGTAALFTAGKYLIGVYLGNSGVTSSYGAAGSLVALLLWIYYSAQIFFFGAEFTRQYALHFGSLRGTAACATLRPYLVSKNSG
jgi:membrane protein